MSNTTIDPTVPRPAPGAKDRTEGHLWLQKMVGEWTVESEGLMPDGSKFTTVGRDTTRKLGEYWIVSESVGPMPGDEEDGRMIISLGYDGHKGKFVGSFIGSMMMGLMAYEGNFDESGTLVLECEAEAMDDDTKTATYRDTTHWEGDDVRVSTSHYQDENGTWKPFMTVRSTRVN